MKPVETIRPIEVASFRPVRRNITYGESIARDVAPDRKRLDSSEVDQDKKTQREQVQNIAENLNRMSRIFDRRIRFEVPLDTKDVIAKIIDRETGKVIRQIPPDEMVELAKRMDEIHDFIFKSKP